MQAKKKEKVGCVCHCGDWLQVSVAMDCTRYFRGVAGQVTSLLHRPPLAPTRLGLITPRRTRVSLSKSQCRFKPTDSRKKKKTTKIAQRGQRSKGGIREFSAAPRIPSGARIPWRIKFFRNPETKAGNLSSLAHSLVLSPFWHLLVLFSPTARNVLMSAAVRSEHHDERRIRIL